MAFGHKRIKHDKLPNFSVRHYWTYFTVGITLGEMADACWRRAVGQLKELPGTNSDDLNAIIRAAKAILELSRDLDRVDESLQRASHMELQNSLFAMPGCERHPSSNEWHFADDLAGAYEPVNQRMLDWADGLPEPERLQAQTWIGERRERALSLFEMSASFAATTRAISDSYLRYKTTQSVAALGSSPEQTRLALEHQLDKVRSAVGVAEIIGAAVDATCPPAPELSALEAPATATSEELVAGPSPELS